MEKQEAQNNKTVFICFYQRVDSEQENLIVEKIP
jgi:hypothetical protein